jgi:hypothetical protein
MPNKRVPLDINEDQIDLEELTSKQFQPAPKITSKLKKSLEREGEKNGFVSREPRRHRRSPYTAQFGGKCRENMKILFQKIGEQLDCHDTVTLELAILALLEKEKLDDLKYEYDKITRNTK